jgi:hypothetical protein
MVMWLVVSDGQRHYREAAKQMFVTMTADLQGMTADDALPKTTVDVSAENVSAAPGERVDINVTTENIGSNASYGVVTAVNPQSNLSVLNHTDNGAAYRAASNEWFRLAMQSNESLETSLTMQVPPTATGDIELPVRVQDAAGHTTSTDVTISVDEVPGGNGPPTAKAGPNQTVGVGTPVELDATNSSDPADDELTYSWSQAEGPTVDLMDADTPTPEFTPTTPGEYKFAVTVSDGAEPDTDQVTIVAKSGDSGASLGQYQARGGLTIHDGRMYVNNGDEILGVNLSAGTVTVRFPAPETDREGLAYADESLWISDIGPDIGDGGFVKLDPETGNVSDRSGFGFDTTGLAFGEGSLWVVDVSGNRVLEFSPEGDRIGSFNIGATTRARSLAYANGSLWIGDRGPGASVYEYETDGTLKQQFGERDRGYHGLAGSEQALYGGNETSNVTVLRRFSGTPSDHDSPDTVAISGLSVTPSAAPEGTTQTIEMTFTVSNVSNDGETDGIGMELPAGVGSITKVNGVTLANASNRAQTYSISASPEIVSANGGTNNAVRFATSPYSATQPDNLRLYVKANLSVAVTDDIAPVTGPVLASVNDSTHRSDSESVTISIESATTPPQDEAVSVTDTSLVPNRVNEGTNQTHTLNFTVKNLSADGDPDSINMTLPGAADLTSIQSMTINGQDTRGATSVTDAQSLSVAANPSGGGVVTADVSARVNLAFANITGPTGAENATTRVIIEVTDSATGSATQFVPLTVVNRLDSKVTFTDQEAVSGDTVNVDSVTLSDGGFVVVHASDGGTPGAVRGVSGYLPPGTTRDVKITLNSPLTADRTLIAMAHADDGDQTYESPQSDAPYPDDGSVDSATVTTADGDSVSVRASDTTIAQGETATIPIVANATSVAGYRAALQFNTSQLQVTNAAGGDLRTPLVNLDNESGEIVLTQSQTQSVSDPVLAELTVRATGPGPTTSLSFNRSGTSLNNQTSMIPIETVENATVTVRTCNLGDMNDDGEVSPLDATLILRHVAGLSTPSTFDSGCADFNDDGQITPLDATLVLRDVAGLPTGMESGGGDNDSRDQANLLTPGVRQSGTIEDDSDVDRYRINVTRGEAIEIAGSRPAATGGDIGFRLYGPSGESISPRDSAGPGEVVTVGAIAQTSGTYILEVISNFGTGDYGVTVTTPDNDAAEPNEVQANATMISTGDIQSGTLTTGDKDWYAFNVTAGETIVVNGSRPSGANSDIAVQLHTPSGESTPVENIGSGESRVVRSVAETDGTYLLEVYPNFGIGNYSINVTKSVEDTNEPNKHRKNATQIRIGDTQTGQLTTSDEDAFSFDAQRGQSLELTASRSMAATGSYFIRIATSGGSTLASAFISPGETETFGDVIESTGTYYVEVDGDSGGYTFTLNSVSNDGFEPNEGIADAVPYTIGQSQTGSLTVADQDWFEFTAQRGQSLELAASRSGGATGSYFIRIATPGGSTLASSFISPGETDTVGDVIESTGTYYVQVDGDSGDYSFTMDTVETTKHRAERSRRISDAASYADSLTNPGSLPKSSKQANLVVGSVSGRPGTTTRVPIQVQNGSIAGYHVNISFNPEVIRIDSVTGLITDESAVNVDNPNGTVTIAGAQSKEITHSTVATLSTKFVGSPRERSPLEIHSYSSVNDETSTLEMNRKNGSATITMASRSLFPTGTPGGSSDRAPTDVDGDGTLEDLNGDGTFDFTDVIEFVFALDAIQQTDLTAGQRAALDQTGDGQVKFDDVVDLVFDLQQG